MMHPSRRKILPVLRLLLLLPARHKRVRDRVLVQRLTFRSGLSLKASPRMLMGRLVNHRSLRPLG
jgi:hypothetical protein